MRHYLRIQLLLQKQKPKERMLLSACRKSIFRQAVRLPRKLQDALFFTPKAQVDKRQILQVLNVRFAAPLKFFLLAIRGYCFVKENPKITTNRTFKILRSLMGIDFYCSKAKTARNTCVFRGFLTKLR